MEQYMVQNGKKLRMGFTTGSAAAGAASAAACMLLGHEPVAEAVVLTPAGVTLYLNIEKIQMGENYVRCAVRKDAGDDPDVTDGIYIAASVSIDPDEPEGDHPVIRIDGGKGVGRVTQPGLKVPVGEKAINPVPKQMIHDSVARVLDHYQFQGTLDVLIEAENGEALAEKTFNPRLGIVGGISILGTSGLVEPMSEKAIVETIRTEIDIRAAAVSDPERAVLMLCPGNYGRDAAREAFGIDIDTAVKCSNYIGESLDYAVYRGFRRILLFGHAGKLVKLAAGIMQTHSRVADGRAMVFASCAADCGADAVTVHRLLDEALTTEAMDQVLEKAGIKDEVWRNITRRMKKVLDQRVPRPADCEFVVFTGNGADSHGICMHMSQRAEDWIRVLAQEENR